MNKYTPEEPIAAIATALVPSAIGIVRTSGKNCIELVSKIFSRKKALLQAAGNSLVYGWIEDSRIQNGNKKIDEVMLGVYKAPKSFTGEDMVEIFCHGGVNVVTSIFSLLLENGFRKAERGEFTFRAYINGKVDLTKAEAVKSNNSPRTVAKNRTASTYANNSYSFELDYDESEEEAEIYYAEINKEKIDYADCFERSNETGWFYPDDDDEEYDTETELYDPFTDEFLDEMEY